jgi:UDP-N-acetylmuramate--alanine ligase
MSLPNTFLGKKSADALLRNRKKLWFIGIGGVHMRSLALFCRARGYLVAGSDTCAHEGVQQLRRAGIAVYVGHHPARLAEYDAAIYTLAIGENDPEYLAAVALGIPVLSRADLLGALTQDLPRRIGVAGSHGKSTVTAMLDAIFTAAKRDPTTFCGALLPSGSAAHFGTGEDCIFEACEYGNSFLCLSPTTAILLNTDFDHADFFESEAALRRSFLDFAHRAAHLICEAENAEMVQAHTHVRTFGLYEGDCHAKDLQYEAGRGKFSLVLDGACAGEIHLSVLGEHNVKNALAAALCAADAGIAAKVIVRALSAFAGTGRRMSDRGIFRGARFFDDYAHHPTEIRASLAAARQITPGTGRIFAVFQPHTYTRTRAFFGEFCEALRAADRVIVADIYPAREWDTLGMSAALLAQEIGQKAAYVGGFSDIARTLLAEIAPGDTVLLMGAGDIDRLFGQIYANHFTLS